MELMGAVWFLPLVFQVVIALPSPEEEAANDRSDVVK